MQLLDALRTASEIAESVVKVVAIIAGGIWAYWKFFRQRANEPATGTDIELSFVGKQDDKWIVEITSLLKNESLVRLKYENFQVTLRYFLPEDVIEDGGEKVLYQLSCPRHIDERIGKKKRFFGNVQYINPKQEFRHRYVTFVPASATFLWVQCKFIFTLNGSEKVNSQRIFRVPLD
jgi:hypothetical protein